MKKKIFASVFIFAVLAIVVEWWMFGPFLDHAAWSTEAQYIIDGDSRQFNQYGAYGHPGGPILLGTAAIHAITGLSTDQSLFVLLTLIISLLVGGISVLCYSLRPKTPWWFVSAGVLSLHQLYEHGTPTSVPVSLLLVLLVLLTIYISEREGPVRTRDLFLWGIVAGLSISTRFDVGSVVTFGLLCVLTYLRGYRIFLSVSALVGFTFILSNPFMWFLPVQHIVDLFIKIRIHYAEFEPGGLTLSLLFAMSLWSVISVALGVLFMVFSRKLGNTFRPVIILALIGITVFLYSVFLTSQYEAPRYYFPTIFIWETLLPMYVFYLVLHPRFSLPGTTISDEKKRTIALWVVAFLFVASHGIIYANNLWVNTSIHGFRWGMPSLYFDQVTILQFKDDGKPPFFLL